MWLCGMLDGMLAPSFDRRGMPCTVALSHVILTLAAAHLRSRDFRPRVRFNDRHGHRESTVRASMSSGTSLLAPASPQGPSAAVYIRHI